MTNLRIIIMAVVIAMAAGMIACKSSKKTTTTNAPATTTTQPTTQTPTNVGPLISTKSKDGINPPENEELLALQKEYPLETLTKLNEGYELYAKTTCTGCHAPKSIYKRDVGEWKGIIDRMAEKAKITESQKDAVYKYVLAIKGTQPK